MVFRYRIVETFLGTGVSLAKADDFRNLLERSGLASTQSSHLKQFVPKIEDRETKLLLKEARHPPPHDARTHGRTHTRTHARTHARTNARPSKTHPFPSLNPSLTLSSIVVIRSVQGGGPAPCTSCAWEGQSSRTMMVPFLHRR